MGEKEDKDYDTSNDRGRVLFEEKMDQEASNDSEMEPVFEHQQMEVCNDSELKACSQLEGILGNTDLDCPADSCTEKGSHNTESMLPSMKINVDNIVESTELKPSPETLKQEVRQLAELEPDIKTCIMKDGFTEILKEPSSESQSIEISDSRCMDAPPMESNNNANMKSEEIMTDFDMNPGAKSHEIEVSSQDDLEVFCVSNVVKRALDEITLEPCPKDKLGDVSNDDVYSEVLNPNVSPKHVTSSLTISSQPLDVLACDLGGYGEITSASSQNSCANRSSFKEKQTRNYEPSSVSSTFVAVEIPRNISTTGIRKITFKFSKQKEDCDDLGLSVPEKTLDTYESHLGQNHKKSEPASKLLSGNDFQSRLWNSQESIEGNKFQETHSHFSCAPNREMKMSKKIIPDNYPTNVKKLLSTRILEGARIKYVSVSGEKEIPGIIKDCGYLCGCCTCNFSNVVSAYEFELHAGTKTRHPNNHIYFENGKPIYNIIQELKTAPLSELDNILKAIAGSSVNEEYFQAWKANLQHSNEMGHANNAHLSTRACTFDTISRNAKHPNQFIEDNLVSASFYYSSMEPFNQQSCVEAPLEQKRPTKRLRYSPSNSAWKKKKAAKGGTKKRDNDLHKLLFMPNGLPDGTDLAYYAKGKRILGGYKQGSGIICSCCNTEVSPSQFEAHAGWSAKRQPYRHIYTSSGLTLHDIALMLANGQSLVRGGSDDMCTVCGDGGKLIICSGCPRAFHTACLDLQCLPDDGWLCPCCTEKDVLARRTSQESKPIILRLTRVVKAPEIETGGCVVCRSQAFSAVKFDDLTVILCDQCEKEYHVGCLRKCGMCDLTELPKDKWFCCGDCDKIYAALQNLASSGPESIPTSVSSAMYRKHAAIGLNDGCSNVIQWRVLSGKSRHPEHLLMLSQAASIFRECFDPIIAKSGRDLIPVMVYGRNISGQEFSGMYCVVLVVNSVVVSAALLRIFGCEAAELPLVATSRNNQGKGFFQALFSCIESLLLSMNVKHMVLPAAEEAEPMWTKKLGFMKASHEKMLQYTRDLQLTIFQGTSLLEKEIQHPG